MNFIRQALLILPFAFVSACGGGGGNSSPTTPPVASNPNLTISATPILKSEEDAPYSFPVTVNNASGIVQFEIENAPAWLRVSGTDTRSAKVSGTPRTDSDTGVFSNIIVSATDEKQRTISLSPFTLEVTAVNDPPVITFEKTSLVLDARERFRINYNVTDEEGDAVELRLGGIVNDLNAEVTDTAITGVARDVNVVRSGNLNVTLSSSGETFDNRIDAKIFPVTESGNGRTIFGRKSGAGVNLVVLGDGYTAQQSDLYRADAEDFITEMHLDQGILSHMSAWNVHVVDTPSNQSGADSDYGTDTVDTYFGSGYNCANIQRLICANRSLVWSTALTEYPEVDQVVLIVNDARYGGSGGSFSIYARSAPSIALHEMGHSFADLRDEYVDEAIADRANSFFEGRDSNVSKSTNPSVVPWSHWIEDKNNYPTREGDAPGQVGVFEGALYNASGFYRPLGDSRMRSNDAFFGQVGTEEWIEHIYRAAGPVSDVMPASSDVMAAANEDVEFSIQPLFNLDIQKITWSINGVVQDGFSNKSELVLNASGGDYVVEVKVEDVTGKVRKPNAYANYSRVWTVALN